MLVKCMYNKLLGFIESIGLYITAHTLYTETFSNWIIAKPNPKSKYITFIFTLFSNRRKSLVEESKMYTNSLVHSFIYSQLRIWSNLLNAPNNDYF